MSVYVFKIYIPTYIKPLILSLIDMFMSVFSIFQHLSQEIVSEFVGITYSYYKKQQQLQSIVIVAAVTIICRYYNL